MNEEVKAPNWLRALDIGFGLIAIIASILVLMYSELAILTLVFVLAIAFLFSGIARIASGITGVR